MDKACEKTKGSIQETGGAFLRDFYFACAVMMRMRPPSGIPPPGASPISPPGMPPMPPPGIIWSSEEGCACGEVDKSENAKTFFAGATAPHRFRNGKCAVCGAADPLAAVKTEALKVLNSIVMNVPDNAEAEAKAREFLVGEWDLGDSGYLVLNDDGTYEWYMMSDKDEKNMHRGVYGCDVENQSLGFSEGEGIYLVLFPEVLYVDGEQQTTSNAKYDYGISLQQQEDGSYQMMNVSTFVIYSMMKQ